MQKFLFLAWQDSLSRQWFPIGQLIFDRQKYTFSYTKGALQANQKCGFKGLQSFPTIGEVYESDELFPIFKNRLLSNTRPEYQDFMQWLNLPAELQNPVAMLARTGGMRETDTLELFQCPQPSEDNLYKMHFFAHGIRHVEGAAERVKAMRPGDKLSLAHEADNPYDQWALKLERDDSPLGYCPRYVNRDFHKLIELRGNAISLTAEQINPADVPIQFRLLCKFTCPWPEDFVPFDYEEYALAVFAKG